MLYHFASSVAALTVPASIRHRREHFGGILFNTRTGALLEIDREAYAVFTVITKAGVIDVTALLAVFCGEGGDTVEELLAQLLALQFLTPATGEATSPSVPAIDDDWPAGSHLIAPETVHWAITSRCQAQCPDCYARRSKQYVGDDLPTSRAMAMIERLAGWGVFQLAIGGGEPLEHPDLPVLTKHARECGLVVHVTTGWHALSPELLRRLAGSVTSVQLGLHVDRILHAQQDQLPLLVETVHTARAEGMHIGVNVMLSRTVLHHLSNIIEQLAQAGFQRITLLRYKPPTDVIRWQHECPTGQDLQTLMLHLPAWLQAYPHITFRFDCALSCLQHDTAPEMAHRAGMRGCVAGERILSVSADGQLYPCSQLVHPQCRIGYVLDDDIEALWVHSPVLQQYRGFRTQRAFGETACGACTAVMHCGGCRVFADDGIGTESTCPLAINSQPNYPHWLL